jgi:hypothetical protein
MVLSYLLEFLAGIQVTPTVACVSHEQPPVDCEGQGEGRAHSFPLRVLRGFLENSSVGLKESVLQITQDALLLTGLQIGKTLERIEQEGFDALYG